MNGYTVYAVIGQWAGFRVETSEFVPLRIVVGWFAFGIMKVDVERMIVYTVNAYMK